jgi:endonuclease YncB( thermonuclease family)
MPRSRAHRAARWILGGLAGVFAFAVLVAMVGDGERGAPTPPTTTSTATAAPVSGPVVELVEVARVIDGDTFELSDGRTVRVLGIDSCEMKAPETYGGEQAKRTAEGQLMNRFIDVTLTAEPGVDTDRYGRLLRYVQVDGRDFGTGMVKYDHTGVYQGENDASDEYIAQLYANDTEYSANPPSGRECADPYPPSTGGGGGDVDVPDLNGRDGALTGGYCGRKWWC